MAIVWTGDDVNAKRCYKVYLKGQYVGTMLLTMEQVREFTAKAVYMLKPAGLR